MSRPGEQATCDSCHVPGLCCAPGWDVEPSPADETLVTLLACKGRWLCEQCATGTTPEPKWDITPYRRPRGTPGLVIGLRPQSGGGWEVSLRWQDGRVQAYRTDHGGRGLWRKSGIWWTKIRPTETFFLSENKTLARAKLRRIFV